MRPGGTPETLTIMSLEAISPWFKHLKVTWVYPLPPADGIIRLKRKTKNEAF